LTLPCASSVRWTNISWWTQLMTTS
jgi:hypothetical protein